MYRHSRNEAIELLLALAADHVLSRTSEGYYLAMGYYQSAQVVALCVSESTRPWPLFSDWARWLREGVGRHA